jgi:hypothetical protein
MFYKGGDRYYLQVFIVLSGLGVVWMYFYIPETKGVPLEEIAALFGDEDEVVIFSENIHVDRKTHELVIDTHGGTAADGGVTHRIATGATESENVQENVFNKV